MKFIETTFNIIKRKLNKIIVKRATITVTDYRGDNYQYDEDSPTHEEISVCLFDIENNQLSEFTFSFLRSEVQDNLEMPYSKDLKYEYLKKIFDFFINVDSQIHEDENGYFSSNLFSFEGFESEPFTEHEAYTFQYKTSNLRSTVRKEIKFYSALIMKYEIKNTSPVNITLPKLVWKTSETSLLELIVALLQTKSIDLVDKKLTQKEAFRIFGQIFSLDLEDKSSLLSHATVRKKGSAPFLNSLKEAFEKYSE